MIELPYGLYFNERNWVHWMVLLAVSYFGLKAIGVL